MMNALALGLLLTSLVTAGIFSPSPEKEKPKEAVIVKEGHRVVVVEYEKDDGNTKVSIASKDEKGYVNDAKDKLSEKMENVKERVKEAASSAGDHVEEEVHQKFSPTELVCDAYGKCKRVIASAVEKTKETVAEKAHGVEEEAKEAVGEAVEKVKHTATDAAHRTMGKVEEAKETVKESASEVSGKMKDKFGAGRNVTKEAVKEMTGKTKQRVEEAVEAAKEAKEKAEKEAAKEAEEYKEKVKEKAREAGEWVESASDSAKERAVGAKEEGRKELREILRRAREVGVDVFEYVASMSPVASVTGVAHLMGFAAAYGMGIWVTFASSYVLAGVLPRQQFAMVQSKIYPVYFTAMAYCLGMALLGHFMSFRKGVLKGFNLPLAAALVMTLVNLLYLEPRATKVMLERMKKEKDGGKSGRRVVAEGKDSTAEIAGKGTEGGHAAAAAAAEAEQNEMIMGLTRKLEKLNSYSSILNVLTLMSLTWHLVQLGPNLHSTVR